MFCLTKWKVTNEVRQYFFPLWLLNILTLVNKVWSLMGVVVSVINTRSDWLINARVSAPCLCVQCVCLGHVSSRGRACVTCVALDRTGWNRLWTGGRRREAVAWCACAERIHTMRVWKCAHAHCRQSDLDALEFQIIEQENFNSDRVSIINFKPWCSSEVWIREKSHRRSVCVSL